MKCISKRIISLILVITCIFAISGCGSSVSKTGSYQIYRSSQQYGIITAGHSGSDYNSSDICLPVDEDVNTKDNKYAADTGAAVVINNTENQLLYAQNLNRKIYPASTTKVLTFITAVKLAKLTDTFTVSEKALDLQVGSTVANLKAGDQLTLEQLLYALLLPSGNDAAVAIAEGCSGELDSFVEEMNKTARSIGATHSHFVNPNGLHDDDHYTTTYDMYLIFHEALKNPVFVRIIRTSSYDAEYKDASGNSVNQTWLSTDHYFTGEAEAPEAVKIIGGKTGTTSKALACLVLLSENRDGEQIISIIYRAKTKGILYDEMSLLLNTYANEDQSTDKSDSN